MTQGCRSAGTSDRAQSCWSRRRSGSSEVGGERAAILCTVLQTAKLNGLDPEGWLADVIDRLASGHPINRLAELLPWNWCRPAAKLAA